MDRMGQPREISPINRLKANIWRYLRKEVETWRSLLVDHKQGNNNHLESTSKFEADTELMGNKLTRCTQLHTCINCL